MYSLRRNRGAVMQATAFLVTVSWYMLITMLLLAWFVGVLTMAMAIALGAALLELYFEWTRRNAKCDAATG